MREKITILEAKDIYLNYLESGKNELIFNRFSLSISLGEFLCILGPSGCGKSTLLKILSGLVKPGRGSIVFEGKNGARLAPDIMLLSQDDNLFPWSNVESQIAFSPLMRNNNKIEIQEKVERLLNVTGLQKARKKYPHELSGGMRKRVAIARALAAEPKILLLDEPFSALDIKTRRQVQQFTQEIWKASRTTMVMVTHDTEEAVLMAERVIVLGQAPCRIIEEFDTRIESTEDRTSEGFLQRQRYLESLF